MLIIAPPYTWFWPNLIPINSSQWHNTHVSAVAVVWSSMFRSPDSIWIVVEAISHHIHHPAHSRDRVQRYSSLQIEIALWWLDIHELQTMNKSTKRRSSNFGLQTNHAGDFQVTNHTHFVAFYYLASPSFEMAHLIQPSGVAIYNTQDLVLCGRPSYICEISMSTPQTLVYKYPMKVNGRYKSWTLD